MPLFSAILGVLLLAVTANAAPAPTAILPTVGPANDNDRRDLDGALRQALLDADEIDLLSPVETRQHLMSLAEMGLVCLPEDVPCLVKLGLVSNVAWVLVPVVTEKPAGRTIALEISVIDIATSKRARTVEGRVSLDDEDAMGALARRAMSLQAPKTDKPPDRPPDVVTPPAEGEGEGEGEVLPPTGGAPSPGAIVAGIGGVVAGVSLVSAVVVELVFANVIQADKDTRKNIQPFGAALWATTVIGAIAVGAGIYLLTEEPAP